MRSKEETFDRIYTVIEESGRLNRAGELRTAEIWKICKYSKYSTIATALRDIMNTMIEQGKAVKLKKGVWRIDTPNQKV